MQASLQFDNKALQKAFNKLSNTSSRSLQKQQEMNSQQVMKSVMFNTPRSRRFPRGHLRGGWLPAYQSSGAPGTGGTSKRPGVKYEYNKGKKSERTYHVEGNVINQNHKKWRGYFEFENKTHVRFPQNNTYRTKYYESAAEWVGNRLYFGHLWNRRNKFMEKAQQEVVHKIERLTERNLDRLARKKY